MLEVTRQRSVPASSTVQLETQACAHACQCGTKYMNLQTQVQAYCCHTFQNEEPRVIAAASSTAELRLLVSALLLFISKRLHAAVQ
jgi:hypothetical protein